MFYLLLRHKLFLQRRQQAQPWREIRLLLLRRLLQSFRSYAFRNRMNQQWR